MPQHFRFIKTVFAGKTMSLTSTIVPLASGASSQRLGAPAWVVDLLAGGQSRTVESGNTTILVRESDEFSLVSVTMAESRRLAADQFQQRTAEAYGTIARELGNGPAPHPVRVWNHLPQIHAPSADGTDRYMAFNAGRFCAYTQWLGSAGDFDRTVPSASAVGHDGSDLVIHALGHRLPGRAIANPRQIAPYHYSKRFGPVPPCFARATVLPADPRGTSRILVGGTASIRGEESVYLDDIRQQTAETFNNLAYLIRAAGELSPQRVNGLSAAEAIGLLGQFRTLRVYYLRETDRAYLEARVAETFAANCRVEFVQADLCRAELLVEIEGMAQGVVGAT
jgi:hypothetical protein